MTPAITPAEFVANWSKVALPEMAAAQSHFNDLCALVSHDPPHIADPTGKFFRFETPTAKTGGKRGRADAAYTGKFIFEYKGAHADLNKAYQQLLLYKDALGNPPLLITSDTRDIIIHTNFTNTVKETHTINFDRLLNEDGLELLQRVFHDPESFKPERTQEQVTQATADTFIEVTKTLQAYETQAEPERLAHFIIRLLFCLFAEDMGLLPDEVFTQLVKYQGRSNIRQFTASLRQLFTAMRDGGPFGLVHVPYFDGGLFDDDYVPDLPSDSIDYLVKAAVQDWSSIDPSIFGTLFERVIDQSKRAQLGAHYTGKDDIMLIVEPVLMQPLRDQWQIIRYGALNRINQKRPEEAHTGLQAFSDQIAATRVLDPACGSGNFLYVSLWQLLDLQKEVITFAGRHALPDIELSVSPAQLYGIEINPYAHELAQTTIWIGYIQWRIQNGFPEFQEPILHPLHNIRQQDAILAYDEDGNPIEPTWPEADVIIGNPPFLGGNRIRKELGDQYVEPLFAVYNGRIPASADLVCYWIERARKGITVGKFKSAGLLATNSIRGGVNRNVLDAIKQSGDIFMAWSDRPWILEGAAVRVSIIGFDNGDCPSKILNGENVAIINSDLTKSVDLTIAKKLPTNANICLRATEKGGAFDIGAPIAKRMIELDLKNREVIHPWANGLDIVRRPRNKWIIDFGTDTSQQKAREYQAPFQYLDEHVRPVRAINRVAKLREQWWLFRRPAPAMRDAVKSLSRFVATPALAKHRLFVWFDSETIPDHQLYVFARDDDYFFGVLHSRVHEWWSLRQGSWLGKGNDPRYTPTSTFETYPFPWSPGREPSESEDPRVFAVAQAARDLVNFRQAWLHPPAEDIGTIIPETIVKRRTLTNLYNSLVHYRENVKGKLRSPNEWRKYGKGILALEQIEQLDFIHITLDHAVLDAYGWSRNLSDEEILEHLLALNMELAKLEKE